MKRSFDRKEVREILLRLLVIAAASAIWAVNMNSFVRAGDLFPGGFTGLTRLVQRCADQFWGIELPFTPVNILFNVFPAAVSFFLIGRKFTLYSCLTIFLTSVFTDLVPTIQITEDMLLVAVFGGIVSGLASSLCLSVRVTAGGTDFISIALSERKNVDAWNYIFMGNVVLLMVAGALFGWDKALYSIIYQYSATQIVRMLDPDGKRETVLIVTGRESAGGVCACIQDTHHTATLIEGVGLYNGSPCVMIYTVITRSQTRLLLQRVRAYDPKAFINVLPTEKVVGRFYRRPRD